MLNRLFTKKFFGKAMAIICSFAILCPNAALAATVTDWTELRTDIAVSGASNTTTLTGNITADSTASLGAQGATALTIQSDDAETPRQITGDGTNTQGISVAAGQTLTLDNIILNGLKDYAVNNQGTLNIQGSGPAVYGNIIDSQETKTGNTTVVEGTFLDMRGHTISQAGLTNNGSLSINAHEVDIDNGITNNSALYVNGGTTAETIKYLSTNINGTGTTFFGPNSSANNYTEITEGTTISSATTQIYGLGSTYASNVINNGTISGATDVRGGGVLTSHLSNLTGTINNNGTLNLNGNNTALNFAVAGTGITNLNGNFTWAEGAALNKTNLTQGSTLDIGTNSVNINGNTNINGTLKMTLDNVSQGSTDMTDNGSLHILGGSLTLGDNSALSLRVNSLEKGQSTGELALFSADNGINGDFATLTDLRYNVQHGSSEGYYIVSYTHSVQDIVAEEGGTVNNQQTAAAWDNIDTSALNQQGQAVYNQLDDLSRSAAQSEKYLEALTTLAPSDSQFVVAGTQAVNKQINANISKHLQARQEQTNNYRQNTYKNTKQKRTKDSLYNTYNLYRGSSGGDETSPYSVWVQGLFSYSSQDKSSKTAGFDGTLTGVSAGFDKAISENFILGIGYAYDHIKTDSAQRDVVANGHNGFIYAFWQPSQWYLSGTASYGLSKYNEDKNVGGVKVDGDYDVQNISAQGILGYQFAPAWSMQGGLIFTNINQKEYTDSASQKIKADDNTVLTGVIGVQYAQETSINSFVFTPKAHLGVSYDLASSGDSATVNIAGNTYKVNSEKLDKFAFEAGVGMETDLSDDVGFALGYDFELRGNFTSHTGNIKFVYHF